MTSPRGCVVVGGGLAAATLVQTLREGGFAEPLTLIGEESDRPYERPALSKDYLQGKTTAGDLYVHPESWYTEHQVQTRFGHAVTEIDRGTRSVRLTVGGERWATPSSCSPPEPVPVRSACPAATWPRSTPCAASATPRRFAPHCPTVAGW